MKYLLIPIMFLLTMCSDSKYSELQGTFAPINNKTITYTFDTMPEINVFDGGGMFNYVEPRVAKGTRDKLGIEAAKVKGSTEVGAKFKVKGVKFELVDKDVYKAEIIIAGTKEDLLFPIDGTFALQHLLDGTASKPISMNFERVDNSNPVDEDGNEIEKEGEPDWIMSTFFESRIYFSNGTKKLQLIEAKFRFTIDYQGVSSRGEAQYPADKDFYELSKPFAADRVYSDDRVANLGRK